MSNNEKINKLEQIDIGHEANRLFGRLKGEEIIQNVEGKRGIIEKLRSFHRDRNDGPGEPER